MTGWLKLSDDQRRITLQQASIRSGIEVNAVEKDWWVTLCLKALYSTPYATYCIFKGGTSLSKGWKLIQRFSEDIDIALDPKAFDMEYISSPTHGYVKKLKRKGCEFTSTKMKDALEQAFLNLDVPKGTITIEAEEVSPIMRDKDPQTLFIRYTSLFDPHPYLASEVKMEFGVRSLKEPFTTIYVLSILNDVFPNPLYQDTPFRVVAVEPRKTLLEKAFLLHEKFAAPYEKVVKDDRQSRHLYDIVQLMNTAAGKDILDDPGFYSILLEHRRNYVRLSGFDYDTLHYNTINFVPSIVLLDYFKKDYIQMQGSMIYGESPEFEDMIRQLKLFNGRFRLMGTGLELEDVIAAALAQGHPDLLNAEVNILKLPVLMQTAGGKTIEFKVTMHRYRSDPIFEMLELVKPA